MKTLARQSVRSRTLKPSRPAVSLVSTPKSEAAQPLALRRRTFVLSLLGGVSAVVAGCGTDPVKTGNTTGGNVTCTAGKVCIPEIKTGEDLNKDGHIGMPMQSFASEVVEAPKASAGNDH